MESKIVFGKMVDYFRRENNLTMEELGVKLGKTKSTISRWISGERSPKMEEVEQLAELFNTDIETLIFGTNSTNVTIDKIYKKLEPYRKEKVYTFAEEQLQEQNTNTPSDPLGKVVQFPIKNRDSANNQEEIKETISYGAVSAGTGEYLFGLERAETVWLPKRKFPTQSFDYVLKINGDSMEPTYQHGEYIFVKSFANGGEVRDGMLAIVLYDNEVYFKKLYIEPDHARLVSLNKDYPEIVITNPKEFTVLGKVIL